MIFNPIVDTDTDTTLLDTPRYDDIRVPVTSTKLGGSKDPTFAVFKTNGSGSQGVFVYWFGEDAEKEIYFSLQIPHSYQLNSVLYPHVHWTPQTTEDGTPANQIVRWGLEYTWADIAETFANTNIIYSTSRVPDTTLTAGVHYMALFNNITASSVRGQGVSSMLICRLFRDGTNDLDTYEADAGLLEIDFHYVMDTLGSEFVAAK